MNDQAATHLVNTSLNHAYQENTYRRLIGNLCKDIEPRDQTLSGTYIPEAFRDHISIYKRLGKFQDATGNKIDVLAVKLKTASKLTNARTMQRNFIARYLDGGRGEQRDAALVAFHTNETDDWRFSLVRMEYHLNDETGKITTELTPARRYSFLVGPHEKTHTARKQLLQLLKNEHPPTLDDIEEVFNIETVTKEFFNKYKTLYIDLKEELDTLINNNPALRQEFETKNISTNQFAKRLMGQIVFLYFLQKKGWLGVKRGEAWGTGSKNFLRELFNQTYVPYTSFFDDILEPLFYEALATERHDSYYARFDCKIPFLNGGLFEPLDGYDWVNTNITIKNQTFETILNTFDLYNFTIQEAEPLEKDVAVDPEMLGKVFENLLEVQDRKSKGAFYTPREIVHYMCQESLINYLDTTINTTRKPIRNHQTQPNLFTPPELEDVYEERLPRKEIEYLVRNANQLKEKESAATNAQQNISKGNQKTTNHQSHLKTLRPYAKELDTALANIKICDPAIGSGAFPVGIMTEIVNLRDTLTELSTDLQNNPQRTRYHFKRHAIQHTIYGVDIDESAVDIAKLRLWLSLIVEEESPDEIQTLPNLDYKIVTGNSVLTLDGAITDSDELQKLETYKEAYFNEASNRKKNQLREQIESSLTNIFKTAQDFGSQANFDFQINFSEVFRAQKGFDVVIGNPPYVRHEEIGNTLKKQLKDKYEAYQGTADLFVYFIELGIKLLKPKGTFSYIVANKWMRANYGKPLRKWLKTQNLLMIVDYGDLPVFANATTYPCILLVSRNKPDKTVHIIKIEELALDNLTAYVQKHGYEQEQSKLDDSGWSLANQNVQKIVSKISSIGVPLNKYIKKKIFAGIKTGYNNAFIIDENKKNEILKRDPKSAKHIKPYIMGKEIKRYSQPESKKFVIAVPSGWTSANALNGMHSWEWFQQEFAGISQHLAIHEERLRARYDQGENWWELRPCAYYDEFLKPKIIYAEIANRGQFTIEDKNSLCDMTTFIIGSDSRYLLGIFNSTLWNFIFEKVSSQIRGGFLRWKKQYMSPLHIRTIDFSNPLDKAAHDRMVEMVNTMLDLHKQKADASGNALVALENQITQLDAEIDALVYELYGLTDEEIKIVEESVKR